MHFALSVNLLTITMYKMNDEEKFKFWQEWKFKEVNFAIDDDYMIDVGIIDFMIMDKTDYNFHIEGVGYAKHVYAIEKKRDL